ncbi:MAG: hypothetical protein LUF02_06860, partial [Erysipelotrichaceae bacterium]|nr:hypothetical protein [Erysipelotrichaceae bacterium]
MNYLSTKLKLIPIIDSVGFISLINNIHQIHLNKDDFKSGMHCKDTMTLFAFDNLDILGISLMKHHRIYEYAYHVSKQELYIAIKMKGTTPLKAPVCTMSLSLFLRNYMLMTLRV